MVQSRKDAVPGPRPDPLDGLTEGARHLRLGHVPGRTLLVLGGALVPLGMLVVLLGWYGASRTPNVYEQVPYLISGGLLGLALVFLGSFLYFAHWLTRLVQEQRTRSAAVVDAINRLVETVERQDLDGSASRQVPNRSSTAPSQHPTQADLVATQSGSLAHRRSCTVVAGKPSVRPVAAADGLPPCRLCHPYE